MKIELGRMIVLVGLTGGIMGLVIGFVSLLAGLVQHESFFFLLLQFAGSIGASILCLRGFIRFGNQLIEQEEQKQMEITYRKSNPHLFS